MWVMELCLSRGQFQQLVDWANKEAPKEVCGLLLGADATVASLVLAHNVAENPLNQFEIDPAALIGAERQSRAGGETVIGYFHSHPNGVCAPSRADASLAQPDSRFWIIIAASKITAWQSVENGSFMGRFEPVNLRA